MFLKKNIWLIFYVLLVLGVIYLAITLNSLWINIQQKNSGDMAYLNRIFSSSVTSTLDQQEIMLDLLGRDLISHRSLEAQNSATRLLDVTLKRNRALVGFGLFDINGKILQGSSNINLSKMPNLKEAEDSRAGFLKTLESDQMELGKTYYLEAINSWVIPIRKAIRSLNGEVIGVMTAGINPALLLPSLNTLSNQNNHFTALLYSDLDFRRLYISTTQNNKRLEKFLGKKVDEKTIRKHQQAILAQLGQSLDQVRQSKTSVEYQAMSESGNESYTSLFYIPKYQLWSGIFVSRDLQLKELRNAFVPSVVAFIIVFIIIFFLFRTIDRSDKKTRQQLIKQANHDFLTGLYNRQYLRKLEPEWLKHHVDGFYTLFIDLDNFKNINDSYGHIIGDAILKQVAFRLVSSFDFNDIICRQGGDEFIILSCLGEAPLVRENARKVLNAISQPYAIDNYQFNIGASIGISRYPDDGQSFSDLFSAADAAMYRAKETRNNFFIFTQALREQAIKKAQIEQALHSALDNKEIYLNYQPQMNQLDAPFGVEALIRWNHPELGAISPLQFISIAEDNGLIYDIGHFVIDQALADLSAWSVQNDKFDLQLSLNISVRQLLENRFLDYLKQALQQHRFPSSKLTLEITESIFINDLDYVLPILEQIRSYGIKISLDDFGTGYSSLSMLKNLPIDELKIDKSFIDHITQNDQDKKLLGNILEIAANLGMKVVAEGVENEEQSMILKTYHCDFQQGYFYARPLIYSDLKQFMKRF